MATEAGDAEEADAALAEGIQVAAEDPRRGEQDNLDVATLLALPEFRGGTQLKTSCQYFGWIIIT